MKLLIRTDQLSTHVPSLSAKVQMDFSVPVASLAVLKRRGDGCFEFSTRIRLLQAFEVVVISGSGQACYGQQVYEVVL